MFLYSNSNDVFTWIGIIIISDLANAKELNFINVKKSIYITKIFNGILTEIKKYSQNISKYDSM